MYTVHVHVCACKCSYYECILQLRSSVYCNQETFVFDCYGLKEQLDFHSPFLAYQHVHVLVLLCMYMYMYSSMGDDDLYTCTCKPSSHVHVPVRFPLSLPLLSSRL